MTEIGLHETQTKNGQAKISLMKNMTKNPKHRWKFECYCDTLPKNEKLATKFKSDCEKSEVKFVLNT